MRRLLTNEILGTKRGVKARCLYIYCLSHIRHPICLSKCVRNYRQFQKHALAPTFGAIVLFTAGKYRKETRLCEAANLAAGGE